MAAPTFQRFFGKHSLRKFSFIYPLKLCSASRTKLQQARTSSVALTKWFSMRLIARGTPVLRRRIVCNLSLNTLQSQL